MVTQEPYSIVHNPIYTGMFGRCWRPGLALSRWIGLGLAVVMFAIGTFIRVRSEETRLREMFATEFDEYARGVAAVIPFLV